jgi:hypothetical protein
MAAKKCHKRGSVSVRICRNKKGRFSKVPGGAKRKSTGGKKKLAKGAHCKPKSSWKNKSGNCYCRTKGGGVRPMKKAQCKKVRRRKAPKA